MASRGRPPLPVGTYGTIRTARTETGHQARARFRDYDGKVRHVSRHGRTKGAARDALREALRDRGQVVEAQTITPDTRIINLCAEWLESVDRSDRAKSTKTRYRNVADSFVVPALGDLCVREVGVGRINRFLYTVADEHGGPNAKTAKSVMSSMMKMAVAHGAITANPVRDADPVRVERKQARALTRKDAEILLGKVAANERAIQLDLVDLCVFLAGSGVRIGEALALREAYVNLDEATASIAATVTDDGLQERTKRDSSRRTISLPATVVAMLRRRLADAAIRTDRVIFASAVGSVRDRSNVTGDLREVFDACGFEWVTSHTFRKSVATWLDDAGMSARQIADHLGHSNVSMTQDVYMGRQQANADAARLLE